VNGQRSAEAARSTRAHVCTALVDRGSRSAKIRSGTTEAETSSAGEEGDRGVGGVG
jgi:hypothetical protein